MKEYLNQFSRFTVLLFATLVLQACGGSSDDKSDKYSISASTSSISFSNEFLQVSDDSFKVDVTFQGNGLLVGYAPDSQPVGWLNFRTENVTATSATLYVDVISAENIFADLYNTKLRLSTGDVDKLNLVHHDIDVSLLVWQMITDKDLVSFRGTLDDESVTAQTLNVTSEANTWTAETDAEWLALDVTENTGDAEITVTADISTFDVARLYQANITLTETTTGDTKVIPVEVGLDRHYLFSDQSTIAFTKLKNVNATSKKVTIGTNSPVGVNWQATSNVDWITITPDNETNELSVAINNDANITSEMNHAVITISAVDTENNIDESVVAESIYVSYYHGDIVSERKVIDEVSVNANALVNSSISPVIYVGELNQLKVFHQYTGELISTISVSPEGTLLENFIIHPDGQFMLAKADETITNEDETTTIVTHRYNINLQDYTSAEILDETIQYEPHRYVSFSGRHFVVTQTLEFADDNLQRLFWNTDDLYSTNRMDQARKTGALYTLDFSDYSFKRYVASINDFSDQKIVVSQSHNYRPALLEENQQVADFRVADDDSGIYAMSPTSEWISFDGESFTDVGLLPQAENNQTRTIAKSNNGRAHFVRFDTINGFVVDIYDESQLLINSVQTQGVDPEQAELSFDDKRITLKARSTDQIELVNIEQFSLSASNLEFTTIFGNAAIDSQVLTINGADENLQISSDSEWLIISTSVSEGATLITATVDTSQISGWGLLSATITITDPNSGSSTVVPVTLAVDEVRLYSSSPSLAFNSQINRSKLSHTVNILSNKEGSSIEWQAQTNADWLTLTPDEIKSTLTISVNLAQIPSDDLYTSEIILSPQTPGESVNGVIQVSFSKGNFDSDDLSEIVIENIIPNTFGMVLDSLRPYLYVAQSDKIDVYNIIDGLKVTSIQSLLEGLDLTNLVMHPDGSLLLASNTETYTDSNDQEQTRTNHYQIDLATYAISQISSEAANIVYPPSAITMVSGEPVVVSQGIELANMELTTQFWDSDQLIVSSLMNDVPGNNNLIIYDSAQQNLVQKTIEYNAFASNIATVIDSIDYNSDTFSTGISSVTTSINGDNIYTANATTEWSTYDGETFAEQGLLDGNPLTSPVSVTTDSDNNIYVYRFDFTIGFFTLAKYDSNQANIWTTGYTGGSTQVFISPDYQRVIHYDTDQSSLIIDYIPD